LAPDSLKVGRGEKTQGTKKLYMKDGVRRRRGAKKGANREEGVQSRGLMIKQMFGVHRGNLGNIKHLA